MTPSSLSYTFATLLMTGLLHADNGDLATNTATSGTAPDRAAGTKATGHNLDLHNSFVKLAHQGDLNIVFFGDSSTACWQTTGKDIWDKDIAPLKAADFGIYGDDAQQLLWRLQNGELDGYQAKAFVVMIGAANLLRGDPADGVLAAITACLDEIKKRQPQARILLFTPPHIDLPLLVPKDYSTRAAALGNSLAKLDDGSSLQVFDMTEAMNARKGEALMQIMAAGDPHKAHVEFEVWWNALKSPLAKIFKTSP